MPGLGNNIVEQKTERISSYCAWLAPAQPSGELALTSQAKEFINKHVMRLCVKESVTSLFF